MHKVSICIICTDYQSYMKNNMTFEEKGKFGYLVPYELRCSLSSCCAVLQLGTEILNRHIHTTEGIVSHVLLPE